MAEKPKKKRISTLAKAYEVSSDVLLTLLKDADVQVKSAASMISAETFQVVKPALLKEKERLDRMEMAKAGIKIPMKAVIKKSVVAKAKLIKAVPPKEEVKVQKEPTVTEVPEKTEPEIEKITEVKQPEPEIVSEEKVDVPVLLEPDEDIAQEVVEEPVEAISLEKEVKEAPEVSESSEEELSKEPTKGLKVVVEKPDEKLAARIQKYVADSARKGRGNANRSGSGYSGKFGKVPGAAKPKRREHSSGDKFKDVFAVRAQQAGVVFGVEYGGDKAAAGVKKETTFQKKKLPKTKGKKKKSKEQIEQELAALKSNVNKVMATVSRSSQKIKYRKEKSEEIDTEEKRNLEVAEFITIAELAGLMDSMPNQVIAKCMELGIMVTINQRLDHETIAVIADEFGFTVKLMEEYQEDVEEEEEVVDESALVPRAPVVTIMGHVDHGKTSILDYIRKSHIVDNESGGITQHIGAYSVNTPKGRICFLDTPGHEAFAAMRSRGAQITDIVILVVAADSMVMPQTKEAIQHAKNANVQIVVAINKCDLPNANVDKIKTLLAEEGVQVDDWGGSVSCVEVSAKTGNNIDRLLEVVSVEAEMMELKVNPNKMAKGSVIETRLDKGKGAVATILVREGTLRIGDPFVCGAFSGKVRSLLDEKGDRRKEAGPSTPVQVLGLVGMPQSGDTFSVMADEKEAREVASRRKEAAKDRELRQKHRITLDQLHEQIESGEFHELKVIVKGDVDGSVEAIAQSLVRLSTPEVKVNIISSGVGAVKEADIHLASASNAFIIAFHILPSESVRQLAENEGVEINYYRIIYEIVTDVQAAMEGMLSPSVVEEVTGDATILQLFKIPKIGFIAGCKVNSGVVDRDSKVRLYRDGIEVSDAKVTSLKRLKDDAKSVKAGLECGIGIESMKNDIKEGDTLAFFKLVEKAKKLSPAIA
ncbi:MAG: translation initiation factor IF-2 [Fibrobacteria bacterium]|nr:translation initiation factor IF-2 [Fibrobacteria bacterium]